MDVIGRESGKPFTNWLAFPPDWVTGRREMIAIEFRANVVRRSKGKWIAAQERKRSRIVVQQFPDEMERPWVFRGRTHGGEPNLPIDARLIRGNERRPQIRITRFGFEFVFFPFGIAGNNGIVGSFENNLVAFLPDGAECAVSVNEAKPIE